MSDFSVKLSIDLLDASERQPLVKTWLQHHGVDASSVTDLDIEVEISFSNIDDADLCAEYEDRFGPVPNEEDFHRKWVDRTYRFLAEGDITAAMEEMSAFMDRLAPPSHERRVARLLNPSLPLFPNETN